MRRTYIKYFYWVVMVGLIAVVGVVSNTNAQTATGMLKGEITTVGPDGKAVYLPGAKTVLKDLGKSSRTIMLFADETGSYEFSGLKAGTYSFEVSLDGFVAVKKPVVIQSDQTVTENVRLELDGVYASVTVDSEDDGAIDTTSSSVSDKISPKNLQNVPLFEEKFQEALPLVPGVVRGPDGLINVKGAQSTQNGTLVGNTNGDDPVTGNMAIDLPLEAVESVQVISNPFSAEYGNFSGGVVQLRTRSGTNKWDARITNFFPRLREREGSIRGVESFKPRLNFGGPLRKDKFFIFQSFEYKFVLTRTESLPDLKSDMKLESFDSFTRVDYNFTDLHRLNVTFALFPQKLDFANINTFNPQDTAANLHQRGWMFALNDQYVTSKGGILQTTFSVKQADADVFGNSSEAFTIAPQTNSGGFFNRQERDTVRYEGQVIYSLPQFDWRGSHLLKIGGAFSFTNFDGTYRNRQVRIARADGTTDQTQTYIGQGLLNRNKSEVGSFVQDKWTIGPRLTIDMGVRFDRDNLGETFNPAPRLGFAFSPFEDNKTLIRGGIGVYYLKVPLNVGVFEQNQNVLVSRFAADGNTLIGQRLYRNVLENGDIETPYSIGWSIRLDRELSQHFLFRIGYEQRETRRDFVLNPFAGAAANEGIYQLGNGGSSSYRELLLLTRVRLQKNRDLYFSYTRSRTAGDLNTFGNFAGNLPDPIVRANEYSRLAFDSPNRFLFWGDIGIPLGLTLTPLVDWRSGFPYSIVNESQDFIGRRNKDNRFPTFFSLDFQVLKDLKVRFRGKQYKFRAGVKFFNLTNHFNPRDVQNNIDSELFGGLFNGVGRRTRFKFEYVF